MEYIELNDISKENKINETTEIIAYILHIK